MLLLLDMLATLLNVALPFVFVFALINAQKFLMKDSLHFVWCGLLAGLCLLLMLHGGVPHPHIL